MCRTFENLNYKNRFSHSRTNKNIYKKKTRTPTQISYDQAAQEYKNFQLENSHIKKQEKPQEQLLVEGFESGDELNSIEDLEKTYNKVNDVDEVEYVDTETENIYSPSTNYATN